MAKQTKKRISETTLYSSDSNTNKLLRLYTDEFSRLNSANIKFYMDAARKGINFFKSFLFEEIKRKDLRVSGVCQTRKLSILAHDYNVTGENQQLVDLVHENFERIGFDQLCADMVEANIQGLAVFQLFFSVENAKYYLNEVQMLPNYLTQYSDGELKITDLTGLSPFSMRSLVNSDNARLPALEIDPVNLLVIESFEGTELNALLNGAIDSLIYAYFFKNYGLKDWAIYLERFAQPGVIGKYDPLMSPEDRNALWKAVKDFGNMFRTIIPNTAQLDLASDANKGATRDLYSAYLKFWNDEISVRVLGQAMTTDTSQGGSYAKALVGNYVRQDIKAGDLSLVTYGVNKLIKHLVDVNFASVTDYPQFEFTTMEDIDYKLKKAELAVALKQAGFDMDEEELSELFSLTLKKSSGLPAPAEFAETEKSKKKIIDKLLLEMWEEASPPTPLQMERGGNSPPTKRRGVNG